MSSLLTKLTRGKQGLTKGFKLPGQVERKVETDGARRRRRVRPSPSEPSQTPLAPRPVKGGRYG